MEGFYRLAKMVVNKMFPEDNDIKPFFICAIYGLLCKFKNYPDIVCDLFLNTDFYLENDTISNILKKYEIEIEFEDEDDEHTRTFAVSCQGHLFVYDEVWDSINYAKSNPFVICSLKDVTIVKILNSFCHEMAHLIKGKLLNYGIYQNENITDYYMRTGFAHYLYRYNSKKDTLTENQHFSYFDEAVNTIQTTEIMKEILNLENITDDEDVLDFLSTLNRDEMMEDHGYEGSVEVVRDLWEIDEIRKILEENIVDGRIENTIYRINKILEDDDGFRRICGIIDNIELNYGDETKDYYLNNQRDKFNSIVNKIKKYQKTKEKK